MRETDLVPAGTKNGFSPGTLDGQIASCAQYLTLLGLSNGTINNPP